MRINLLAVAAVASLKAQTSLAFAPNAAHGIIPPRTSLLPMEMASSKSDRRPELDETSRSVLNQARNGFLSLVASSFIFLGPAPSIIDPAYAATPTPSAQVGIVSTSSASSSSSKSSKTIQSTKPIDPLSAEKANVEAAKEKYNAAVAASTKAKKGLADANTAFSKAETAAKSAENKVASSKKALIAANDKLADAKAKEGANGGNLAALGEVEKLASKVGKQSRV